MGQPQSTTVGQRAGAPIRGFLGFWVCVYILPITAVWAGVLPFYLRYPLLVAAVIAAAVHAARNRRSAIELGFRSDTARPAYLWHAVTTTAGILGLITLRCLNVLPEAHLTQAGLFYAFYAAFSSPVQEFLFRSVLFCEMQAAGITHRPAQVVLSAVTFSYVHVVYERPVAVLATLAIGLIWGAIYARYPNFWTVTASHAVLGAVAITTGLV
jgi:uncharacterized protein